jgi:hypothetical protein
MIQVNRTTCGSTKLMIMSYFRLRFIQKGASLFDMNSIKGLIGAKALSLLTTTTFIQNLISTLFAHAR